MNLQRKCAFVTGSTSGIGLAIARRLAAQACNVGLNGFGDADRIHEIVAEIRDQTGVEVFHCDADLTIPDEVREAIRTVICKFGRIDILINNAGVQHVDSVRDFPEDKWDEILAVNLSAVFHATKAVIPEMISNGWGRIVNIASVHGLVGSVNKSAYVAAKHGVVGFTKVVALENAKHALTCNAVCPGWVDTELINQQVRDLADAAGLSAETVISEMLADRQPVGRYLDPEEIASLVAYLCSDEARGITGAAISIDGGWSAR